MTVTPRDGGSIFPEDRRTLFDQVAEVYDEVRPTYPTALIDDLAEAADLGPGVRILEIGCGTGELTVALAERRASVIALELGTRLADLARRKLARHRNVEVIHSAFEAWPLPPEPFDLVVSATAFHWLDRTIRVPRCAAALRPGGLLAVIDTHHIAGGTARFFRESQWT